MNWWNKVVPASCLIVGVALLLWGCQSQVPANRQLGNDAAPSQFEAERSSELSEYLSRGAVSPSSKYKTRSFDGRRSRPPGRTREPREKAQKPDNGAFDELWIIPRDSQGNPMGPAGLPGSGALVTRDPDTQHNIVIPLEHTDVRAQIDGCVASVVVNQQFHNPYDTKIEAKYVFPLPQDAAVTDFEMTVGERRIRGVIREREQAEQIYQAARRQGRVASLLTQERPNVFTQSVANIEPGKSVAVAITYFNTLRFVDGAYEFVFPMIVGPRFNPPGSQNGIGAVAVGQVGASRQPTEVSYLRPAQRSGHDIAITVELDAGLPLGTISSPTHAIEDERASQTSALITLSANDQIPNRDFVLRYVVAGENTNTSLVTHEDDRGGFFQLLLVPPANLSRTERRPCEFIFVLDCSGSMQGRPLRLAKSAAQRALRHLQAQDTFQIVRFSQDVSQLGPAPIRATPENVRRGVEYLESLKGSRGTHMIQGIKAALDFPHDESRLRIVSFLTDGYIGNEVEIFQAIDERLGSARLFGLGVGSSVNRYLLDGISSLGRGAVTYVGLDESAVEAADSFYRAVSHAALTDVAVDWNGLEVSEVTPRRSPDLLVGRPVVISGRYTGEPPRFVRVSGWAEGVQVQWDVPLGEPSRNPAIASVWARQQIRYLSDLNPTVVQRDANRAEIRQTVLDLALQHNLMSAYTAFVAVDTTRITEGDHGVTVPVPVPTPAGVRYETTVGD